MMIQRRRQASATMTNQERGCSQPLQPIQSYTLRSLRGRTALWIVCLYERTSPLRMCYLNRSWKMFCWPHCCCSLLPSNDSIVWHPWSVTVSPPSLTRIWMFYKNNYLPSFFTDTIHAAKPRTPTIAIITWKNHFEVISNIINCCRQ